MPFEWLLGLVGLGVPGVILLAHLTGGSALHALTLADLEALLEIEHITVGIAEHRIGADGASALIALDDGRLGVAWVMESRRTLRMLSAPMIARVDTDADGLRIHLRDAGSPQIRVQLGATDSAAWTQRFDDLGRARGAA